MLLGALQSGLVACMLAAMEDEKDSTWKSIKAGAKGFRKSTKRMYNTMKKSIRAKKIEKATKVEEIHITPEPEEDAWASRPIDPATRRQSTADPETRVSSAGSTASRYSSSSKENQDLEIVDDLETDSGYKGLFS